MGSGIKRLCHECGVPKRISKLHDWLDNGTIVERRHNAHRMIFIENDNLRGIFTNVEDILGISIEHIIIESQRKSTYDYVENMLPRIAVKLSKLLFGSIARNLCRLAMTMGYGYIEDISYRYRGDKDDFVTMVVKNSYYPPSQSGTLAGAVEAVSGNQTSASFKEISQDTHEITASVSELNKELSDRLAMRVYPSKAGSVGFERCTTCGLPRAMSEYEWKAGSGTIESRADGRRMVLVGPSEYETIFDELEKELGESITRVIIEAQRRYVKAGVYPLEEVKDDAGFRRQLAVRGLGNLRELVWEEDKLRLLIENACLHMLVVGMAQGFFELASGKEADVDWELARDGDLKVRVVAKD